MGKLWIAVLGIAAAAAGGALAPSACANLNDLPQNTCGNLIVEQTNNEDCDTLPVGADGGVTGMGQGFACSSSCRVTCAAADAGTMGTTPPNPGTSRCPDGWGCGIDSICRRPSGVFGKAAVDIPETVEHVLLGDLDGDGRQDVVVNTGAELRVHYFAAGAALDQTVTLGAPQAAAALGDFNGDGISDIAYGLPASVAVRLGSSDRSLPAVPFPVSLPTSMPDLAFQSGERVIALGTVPVNASLWKLRELLRVGPTSITTFLGKADPNNPSSAKDFVQLAPVGLSNLPPIPPGVIEIPVGWLDNGQDCQQIVFANAGKNQVEVYPPCVNMGGNTYWNDGTKVPVTQPLVVTMPMGVTIAGPVYLRDIDGDGYPDITVYGMGPSGPELDVAYSNGYGKFNSTPFPLGMAMPDGMAGTELCLSMAVIPSTDSEVTACRVQVPFAVADFNGDGVLDLVNGCGIFLGGGGKSGCGLHSLLRPVAVSTTGLSQAQWTTARLVDLNGDGHVDVVAATCGDTVVTYFESANGNDSFNQYTIPASGGVDHIAVGDFDGDLIEDVAFSQRIAPLLCMDWRHPDTPMSESIAIAFGAYSGGPSAPVELALQPTPLGPIQQLVPAYLSSPTGNFQLISNLVALTPNPQSQTHLLGTVFEGSPDREIVAPYYLVDTGHAGAGSTPWLIATGHIGSETGGAGIAVVSSERVPPGSSVREAELWYLAEQYGNLSSLTPAPKPLDKVGDPSTYAGATTKGAWLSTVNLGGTASAGDTVLGLAFDMDAGTTTGLYSVTAATPWPPTPMPLPGFFHGPIVVSDLNGDGNDDVIVHSSTQVAVLWNDGSGSLGTQPTYISVANACNNTDGNIVAVTALRTAPQSARQILIVSDSGNTYLATPSAAPTGGSPSFTVTCFNQSLAVGQAPGDVFLVAGDVDGDGVDDVVLGRPGSVQVFRGTPVVQ